MKTPIIFIAIIIQLAACESFVTGIDENDITRPRDAELKQALVSAELAYMGVLEGDMARMAGLWSGYFFGVDRQSGGYYHYDVAASTFVRAWDNVYASALKNLMATEEKAAALNNTSVIGICQVMEASLMGTAAAIWGDVPFTQAVNYEQFPNPQYEPQVTVIDKCIEMIDAALVNLNANKGSRPGDFLDLTITNTRWMAVANSVKARLLLYKKDYSNALHAANMGIQLPANDLLARHSSENSANNMYYQFLAIGPWSGSMNASNAWLGRLLSATASGNRNHTKTNEAARLVHYYSGNTVETYTPNTSGSGYFASGAGFPLHTAFETKLIAAECLLRTGDFNNALTKLNEHRANLRAVFAGGTYTDFNAVDFDPFGIENTAGTLTAKEALLLEILEEKYVCLYGQIEAFTELRRTNNALDLPANVGEQHPQRFLYSQTEIEANTSTPNPIPGLFEKTDLFE